MLGMRPDGKLYIVELILTAGICLFTVIQNSGVVSGLFYLTFIILALGLVLQLYNRPWLNELHVLAAILIVLSFFHVAWQADTWSFDYYKKLLMFYCTVLMVPFLDGIQITGKHVSWILGIHLCIAALYPLAYFTQNDPGYLGWYLTFHYTNPNMAAMFLLHSVLYCAIAMYYVKKRISRMLILMLILMLVYFVYLTGARSCYIAMVFFAALVFFNIGLKKEMAFSPGVSLLVLLLPLMAALVYMAVVESGMLENMFSFLVREGKPLDARADIWKEALEAFARNPIFGDYRGIATGGSEHTQMHNTHLDVLASYGLVPFVLFVAILYRGVLRVLPGVRTKFSRMALFAFFAIMIQGTFEAALVAGGSGLYIMSFGFLFLAKYKDETE